MKNFEIERTDEEREELVKAWISNNWLMVVFAVLLAIAAVWGLNYFKQSKINALSEQAKRTQQVIQSIKDNQIKAAQTAVSQLQKNSKESSFSAVATLSLAKKYFNNKNYAAAIQQYDWLMTTAGDVTMRDLARLRKARAQADNQQLSAAINTLDSIEGKQNIDEANLLKGDILLADGQFELAKTTYENLKKSQQVNLIMISQRLELLNIKQESQL
ncbi:MAG: YfgM family protein [Ostreibacterium sp.]